MEIFSSFFFLFFPVNKVMEDLLAPGLNPLTALPPQPHTRENPLRTPPWLQKESNPRPTTWEAINWPAMYMSCVCGFTQKLHEELVQSLIKSTKPSFTWLTLLTTSIYECEHWIRRWNHIDTTVDVSLNVTKMPPKSSSLHCAIHKKTDLKCTCKYLKIIVSWSWHLYNLLLWKNSSQ